MKKLSLLGLLAAEALSAAGEVVGRAGRAGPVTRPLPLHHAHGPVHTQVEGKQAIRRCMQKRANIWFVSVNTGVGVSRAWWCMLAVDTQGVVPRVHAQGTSRMTICCALPSVA